MTIITYHLRNGETIRERHIEDGDQAKKTKEVLEALNTQEWISIREGTSGPSKMIRSEDVEAVEVNTDV